MLSGSWIFITICYYSAERSGLEKDNERKKSFSASALRYQLLNLISRTTLYLFIYDYKHHQILFKSFPEVDVVITSRRIRNAEFPVRELHYEVLFKTILKTTHKKTAPLPTTKVFNSNNASFTCSKKADSMSKDAETTASVFMELSLKTVIKFYKFNWVHPGTEK